MPVRRTFLATGYYYHIYNRSEARLPIFTNFREVSHFLNTLEYYLYADPPIKYSIYRKKPDCFILNKENKIVDLINYCLMPNHFHLTLQQLVDKGISTFLNKITNSYSHYFHTKNESTGHLFESNFKAEIIESDYYLVHLSRYIHLNPVTSGLSDKPENFPYSSYKSYLGLESKDWVNPLPILCNFSQNNPYRQFVDDQIDYQKELYKIKHLTFE